jgi:MarR family transcriptional regulator, organic hydroperoxide resistance regulator
LGNQCLADQMTQRLPIDAEKTIGVALHQASYLFKTAMRSAFQAAGHDATPEEFVALMLLPDAGIDHGDLVLKLKKEKTNVTRLLARMESKGWIKRAVHAQSGRQLTIVITPLGEKTRRRLLPLVEKVAMRALDGIKDADVETARRTLTRFAENLMI